MENQLVKVDHAEFGIQEGKAKEISALFKPMLDKMEDLAVRADEVLSLPMGQEAYSQARELRLEYKRTRTGTAEIHKKAKAHSLAIGKCLDGWKNSQALVAHGVEDKLAAIENHEAIEKQRKIDVLQEKRTKALKKFDLEVVPSNLGELDTVSWNNYLTGTKVNFDKKKKAEKEEETKRLEKEKETRLFDVRFAESAKYEEFIEGYGDMRLGIMDEKAYHDMIQKASNDHKAKQEQNERDRRELERLQQESKERDDKAEKERKDREEIAIKERAVQDAKLKKERADREKAEKELADRKELDARILREKEERLQSNLNQDDATKVENLVKDLEELALKYTFRSDKNQKMYLNVGILLVKIRNYIQP